VNFERGTDENESSTEEDDCEEEGLPGTCKGINPWAHLHTATNVTVLGTIHVLLSYAHKHQLKRVQLKDFWLLMTFFLPRGHRLPTLKQALSVLADVAGLKPTKYHACPKGCVLFRDAGTFASDASTYKYAAATACPYCHKSRFKDDGVTPAAVVTWIGLKNQLMNRHWWPEWATATKIEPVKDSEQMSSMHDSPEWRRFLEINPHFVESAADILMYATDGFNPFKGSIHSCWPHLFKILNLGPYAIGKANNVLLAGISHGPRAPESLRGVIHLVNEELWELKAGVICVHPVTKQQEPRYGALFCHGADYPALSKVNEQTEAGSYSACMNCYLVGEKRKEISRMVYQIGPELPADKTIHQVCASFVSVWDFSMFCARLTRSLPEHTKLSSIGGQLVVTPPDRMERLVFQNY
jgi:hypothetical protein